jgi:hypothetical protein
MDVRRIYTERGTTLTMPLVADEQLSDEYRRKGFQPHWPVVDCKHHFTLDDAVASLTKSKFSRPKWVGFEYLLGDEVIKIRVVITSLTAIYLPAWSYQGFWVGYANRPDYRFEGRIVKEALDPEREPTFVRGYLPVEVDGSLQGEAEIQRIN